MEMKENGREYNLNPIIEHELGKENVKNIDILGKTIKKITKEKEIETHLVLVGGNVRPEKRGKWHKDVDLVVYSPQLAPRSYFGDNDSNFGIFADFMKEVGQDLGWQIEVEEPWFFDYEMCGDGKITLIPLIEGKPIELLPVREDRLFGSFENYLQKDTDPHVVLF